MSGAVVAQTEEGGLVRPESSLLLRQGAAPAPAPVQTIPVSTAQESAREGADGRHDGRAGQHVRQEDLTTAHIHTCIHLMGIWLANAVTAQHLCGHDPEVCVCAVRGVEGQLRATHAELASWTTNGATP